MNGKARVLVVDDEASARSGLEKLLKQAGYDVDTAADGAKALAIASERPPDVVVTDLDFRANDARGSWCARLFASSRTRWSAPWSWRRARRSTPTICRSTPRRAPVARCAFPGRPWRRSSGAIETALEATQGSTTRAAELLDLSVRTVQYRLQEYGATAKTLRGGGS